MCNAGALSIAAIRECTKPGHRMSLSWDEVNIIAGILKKLQKLRIVFIDVRIEKPCSPR